MAFEKLVVHNEEDVLFLEIAAPPMNLLARRGRPGNPRHLALLDG